MRATNPKEADEMAAVIINQSWLEAGHTQEELDQSERIADLLDRLVASGRSMESVLDEWQGKSAEEISAAQISCAEHRDLTTGVYITAPGIRKYRYHHLWIKRQRASRVLAVRTVKRT
jgi:hypothetical protein